MLVQVHTDSHLKGRDDIVDRVRKTVSDGLARHAERITRVDVHLSDENATKGGAADKRCVIEARPAGMQPIVARHQAPAFPLAVDGALDKLQRALESAIGRLESR